jgi:hypothetical protein
MPRLLRPLEPLAQAELDRCVHEGASVEETRRLLIRYGCTLPYRTLCRRMKTMRAEAEARRLRIEELREIGRGLAASQMALGGAAAIVGIAVPEWREDLADATTKSFHDFLQRPTAEAFSALVTGTFALLIASQIAALGKPRPFPVEVKRGPSA